MECENDTIAVPNPQSSSARGSDDNGTFQNTDLLPTQEEEMKCDDDHLVLISSLHTLEEGEEADDAVTFTVAGSLSAGSSNKEINDDNTVAKASSLPNSEGGMDDIITDTAADSLGTSEDGVADNGDISVSQTQFTHTDPLYSNPTKLPLEESNFLRFCHLIQKLAPEAVRHRFDQEFPPNDLDSIIHGKKTTLNDLKFRRVITKKQFDLIFPNGSSPVSSSFDVTLMLCLFRHLTNISPISGDYDSCPPPSDVTLGGDLARIKYYRNKIAHYSEKDRKMDNQDFSIVWETVSKAVGRIGGPSYEQQCTTLLTTSLDSSYLDIYREFVELLSKQREHMEILESKQVELEKKLNDPVSPIETGTLTDIQITEWQEMDKKCIVTRASEHVLQCIKTNKCVTVTGSSGVGKTVTIRHVAVQMKKEGYTILPIKHPWDVVKSYDHNKKILFVIDDCCGKYHISQIDLENWKKEMDDTERLLEKSCAKIIIGCRLQVYFDPKFDVLSLFKSCDCNMQSEKLSLTVTERTAIAKLYLKDNADKIAIDDKFDCFPLLCRLCENRRALNFREFFKNPFEVYEAELKTINSNGAEVKLCVLALIVMFNNQLKENLLTEDIEDRIRLVIQNTCEAFRLNIGTSRLMLRDELESLINTYLSKHDNMYSAIHDKLFDFLAYYFGKSITSCLIKNADSCFIRERFVYFEQETNDQFTITLPEKYQQMYIDRLSKDLSEGEVVNVFSNINMKIDRFRKIILLRIQKLDLSSQNSLANMTDKRTEETILIRNCCNGYDDFIYWCLSLHVDVNVTTPDGVSPLFMTCFMGHTHIVQMLLKHNADLNRCTIYGATPLSIACQEGHTKIVNMLLNHDADVNKCTNNDDVTSLFIACQNGHTKIVNMLLNHNADVNKCTNNDVTPFSIACQNGHTEIVNMLLKHNADVNKCTNNDVTPLSIACQNGHTEIVNMLFDHNADINKCGNNDTTPLYMACQNGHTLIVNMLLNHNADLNKCTNDDATPLYIACQNGYTEIVNMLLNRNADINKCTNDGESSLYAACKYGHTVIVRKLLNANADVNKCWDIGASPLFVACQFGHTETVIMLLNTTANIDMCINNGATPLFIACHNGRTEIVKTLLNKNADINKCYNDGTSPLYIACAKGHTCIVNELIDKNADINSCANNGQSPLFIACENGHTEIVKILLTKKADSNRCNREGQLPLNVAHENGYTEIVKMFQGGTAYINRSPGKRETPLFLACQNGRSNSVGKLLLQGNAGINTCVDSGATPLFIACRNGHHKIVNMLLEHKADVNMCRNDGTSPLYIACEKGHTEIVSQLLDKHADIGMCANHTQSPLFIACLNGYAKIVAMLLDKNADVNKKNKDGLSPMNVVFNTEILTMLHNKP